MTSLAALRRASATQARGKPPSHARTLPRVVAVPVCTHCGLPTTAPGVCPAYAVTKQAGRGHTSTQPVTNRAARRLRVIRATDGSILGRTYPRAAWLRTYSRVQVLHRAAAHDRARLLRLSPWQRQQLMAADTRARARKVRRLASPGRLRAEAYEAAWATARSVKQQARLQAHAQAEETVARMHRRRLFGRKAAA